MNRQVRTTTSEINRKSIPKIGNEIYQGIFPRGMSSNRGHDKFICNSNETGTSGLRDACFSTKLTSIAVGVKQKTKHFHIYTNYLV